jgi:hypothetical protein
MNEGEFSAPTQTFGRMLLKVFERVAGRPGYQARLSAGELHLVISTDGPRTLRTFQSVGVTPPSALAIRSTALQNRTELDRRAAR